MFSLHRFGCLPVSLFGWLVSLFVPLCVFSQVHWFCFSCSALLDKEPLFSQVGFCRQLLGPRPVLTPSSSFPWQVLVGVFLFRLGRCWFWLGRCWSGWAGIGSGWAGVGSGWTGVGSGWAGVGSGWAVVGSGLAGVGFWLGRCWFWLGRCWFWLGRCWF